MEIKRKQKTLAGLFLKFAVLFCVNTILIVAGCTLLLIGSCYVGITLPSNYEEVQLTEHTAEIQSAGMAAAAWIPQGCTYGIYGENGAWKTGNFTEKESDAAWMHFENENNYASTGNYYRFIRQENGNICIVKYSLYMKYASDKLNASLPAPEKMSFILDGVLFVLNAVFLSRHFAKKLNCQLGELRKITDKIAENDLEFETNASEIKEIDDVMDSLSKMKKALRDSLTVQWDMEQQKQEQLAALTHDIKTPLTIIKGNAELLAEAGLAAEDKECTGYILSNVGNIEQYLEHIKQVLYGNVSESDGEKISCAQLGELLQEAATQVTAAEKIPIIFEIENLEGEVCCKPENILRAWENILSNAAERTDKKRGIEVRLKRCTTENQEYLAASVRDYGAGFLARDLEHADQEFYSGDASRHDRKHQGLGLAIAKRFLEEQGGMLRFGNHAEAGAEVECWVKICGG